MYVFPSKGTFIRTHSSAKDHSPKNCIPFCHSILRFKIWYLTYNVTEQRVIKLQLLIFCTLDLFWVTRVAVAENDTDHVTCKMEPLQLVKMDWICPAKNAYVRAKSCLTGQCVRHLPNSYFKPCLWSIILLFMLNFILGSNIIIFTFFQQVIVHSRTGEKRNKSEPIIRLNHNISWLNLIFFTPNSKPKQRKKRNLFPTRCWRKFSHWKKKKKLWQWTMNRKKNFSQMICQEN